MWEHLWYQVNGYNQAPAPVPQLLKFTPQAHIPQVSQQRK
jgi:hypothetical protein